VEDLATKMMTRSSTELSNNYNSDFPVDCNKIMQAKSIYPAGQLFATSLNMPIFTKYLKR